MFSEENKIIGVCLFDDPTDPSSGCWFSVAGEEAKRASGVNALPPKLTWVTNIKYNDFRQNGLSQLGNIKETHYMRTDTDKMIKELCSLKNDNNMENCRILSEVFNRTVVFGTSNLGVQVFSGNYKYLSCIEDAVNLKSVKAKPFTDYAYIQEAIENSYQANQGRLGVKPNNTKDYTFVFPRTSYYRWLLSKKLPVNSDQFATVSFKNGDLSIGIKDGRLLDFHNERFNKFSEMVNKNDFAYFFQIEVPHIEKSHTSFATFSCGNGSGRDSFKRTWASLPEILHLSRFSVVKIFNGYKTPLSHLPSEITSLVSNSSGDELDMIEQASLSKGLFLENVFSMLAGKIGGSGSSGNNTALGAYLRAYDRMACLCVAEMFNSMGYAVGSYSTGRILLFLKDNEVKEACGLAMLLGLIPPIGVIENQIISTELQLKNIKRVSPNLVESEKEHDGEISEHLKVPFIDKDLKNELRNDFTLKILKLILETGGVLNTDFILLLDRISDYPSPDDKLRVFNEFIEKVVSKAEKAEEDGGGVVDSHEVLDM